MSDFLPTSTMEMGEIAVSGTTNDPISSITQNDLESIPQEVIDAVNSEVQQLQYLSQLEGKQKEISDTKKQIANLLSPYSSESAESLLVTMENSGIFIQMTGEQNQINNNNPGGIIGAISDPSSTLNTSDGILNQATTGVLAGLATLGAAGLLQNIVESASGTIGSLIDSITKGSGELLSKSEKQEVVELLQQGTDESKLAAAKKIAEKTGQDPKDVFKEFKAKLVETIAGTIIIDASQTVLSRPAIISSNDYYPDGSFEYVGSFEELEAEMISISRDITEVVVHWTETFTNANITAAKIDEAHKELGHSKIGYHYIITRDGSLQRGRPVDEVGEHCPTNGHNNFSIGIAFVGGLNISTGTNPSDEFTAAASLSREQFNTFNEFIRVFLNVYPGGQILGHNDIDYKEKDPGFDVIEYCNTIFGYCTLFDDPSSEPPFSPAEIAKIQFDGGNQYDIEVLEKDS